jgi:hypothetical protein
MHTGRIVLSLRGQGVDGWDQVPASLISNSDGQQASLLPLADSWSAGRYRLSLVCHRRNGDSSERHRYCPGARFSSVSDPTAPIGSASTGRLTNGADDTWVVATLCSVCVMWFCPRAVVG